MFTPSRAALLLCSLLPLARAAPVDDALSALMSGKPDVSIQLLRGKMDAPSLVVLARSYVGQSLFVSSLAEKKRLYSASEAAARAALGADPKNAEASIELANALALQLQGAGVVQATRTGLEIKKLFERAVALDPSQGRAWMGLGTWHAQALSLGSLLAFAAGASEQTMRSDFQQAVRLSPNEIFFRLSYADGLLLLAKSDSRRATALKAEARNILREADKLTPQNYWQRYDKAQVSERLKALGAG